MQDMSTDWATGLMTLDFARDIGNAGPVDTWVIIVVAVVAAIGAVCVTVLLKKYRK